MASMFAMRIATLEMLVIGWLLRIKIFQVSRCGTGSCRKQDQRYWSAPQCAPHFQLGTDAADHFVSEFRSGQPAAQVGGGFPIMHCFKDRLIDRPRCHV